MFTSILNRIQNNLASATEVATTAIQHFNPWDHLLTAATVATPWVLGLPWYASLLSVSAVGISLVAPRKENLAPNLYTQFSREIENAKTLIREICDAAEKNGKSLKAPDYVLIDKGTHNDDLHARTVITSTGESVLILPVELSAIDEAELAILLEHELAHLHFEDPVGKTYTRRLYLANTALACMGVPSQLLLSLGWSGMMYLIKQASSRYREYRADHYAFQDTGDGKTLNHDKIANLKKLITQKDQEALEKVHAKSLQEQEPLMEPTLYLINSYINPKTQLECVTNDLLNLVKTHPTPRNRFNI